MALLSLATYAQEDFNLKEFVSEKNKLQGRIEAGYIINLQNERKPGFIITSDDARNSKYIYFQKYKGAYPDSLTVDDIISYGFGNEFYTRFVIETDTVFMKKMNEQEPFLYYCKINGERAFYIEDDNGLHKMPKEKQELIKELKKRFNQCENFEYMNKAIHNKNRLANILDYYSNCNTKKLPYFKYGIFAGSKVSGLVFSDNSFQSFGSNVPLLKISNIKFDPAITYNVGLYLDMLIIDNYNWTFHPEIEYTGSKYIYTGDIEILNSSMYPNLVGKELSLSVSYINLDLFFRYNTLAKNTSLIFDIGPILSYYIPKAELESTEVEFDFNTFMMGVGGNLGVETPVFKTYNLTTGINANYLFSSGEGETIKFSTWNVGVFVGFGF